MGAHTRTCQDYGFLTDFSLLFCQTHFTFVDFSYPYDTNLVSYLPFILSYAFILTDHTRRRSKVVDWIQRVVVHKEEQTLLSSNDEGRTLHWPRIKSSSHSKPLFFLTTLFPLRALHSIPHQHRQEPCAVLIQQRNRQLQSKV